MYAIIRYYGTGIIGYYDKRIGSYYTMRLIESLLYLKTVILDFYLSVIYDTMKSEKAKRGMRMEEMLEELTAYYAALGYPLYQSEQLKELSDEELVNLYELTFPNGKKE